MEKDLRLVGEAGDGEELLDVLDRLQPDIILLDLKMPGMNGFEVLQRLQCTRSASKVIVFTASENKNEWVRAMKLGCSGIVVKDSPPEMIVKSIRKVSEGQVWLDSHTTAAMMHQFAGQDNGGHGVGGRPQSRLSNREREVVALVVQGYRNREMAERLSISEQTVKNHLHNIFDKLRVSDRLELALHAVHEGLHLNTAQTEELQHPASRTQRPDSAAGQLRKTQGAAQ